jgi:hypothetical protein
MKVRKTEELPPESARRNCDGTCDGDHPPTGALVIASLVPVLGFGTLILDAIITFDGHELT